MLCGQRSAQFSCRDVEVLQQANPVLIHTLFSKYKNECWHINMSATQTHYANSTHCVCSVH